MNEQDGFQVNESIDVQDLTDVKQERSLIPVAQAVLVRIAKTDKSPRILTNANPEKGKVADLKSLGVAFELVEGVPTTDTETGETVMKYRGMKLSTGIMDLPVWANLEAVSQSGKNAGKTRSDINWWKKSQHLVGTKQFCQALDIPLAGLKVNDEFLTELVGRELRIDIGHEKAQVQNPETGEYVDSGELVNRIKAYRKA